jgi:hypothetical protein
LSDMDGALAVLQAAQHCVVLLLLLTLLMLL